MIAPAHDETVVRSPTDWQHLDRRMLAVHPLVDLVKALPVLAAVVVTGGSSDDRWHLGASVAVTAAVLLLGASRWFTTTYRIGDDRVELRTGLLRRRHRSVHRDRIRTADLTANLAHRAFGLAVVRVGTGSRAGRDDAELRLDAVGRLEAERLRALLLGMEPVPVTRSGTELARWRLSWVRFAPLTFSALAVVGAVWAGAFRIAEDVGWRPEAVARASGQAPVWLGAVALLVTAVLGAAVVFVESWWGYRLRRGDDGGLVVHRGLLTRRTLSLAGRRIRGVELDEPLLLRWGRGARPLALTTGLRAAGEHEHVGALAPAVPRREARRIAAAALGAPSDDTVDAPMCRHPRGARNRRLTRAIGPGLVLAVIAAMTLPAPWGLATALAVTLGATWLGWSRRAALGHALTRDHLVSRHGSWHRRTVVLRRGGVIGWRISQSMVQRRSGLVTLHVATAAGRGHVEVLDVGVARALEIVDGTTPGLLGPFVDPSVDRGPGSAAPAGSLVER